MIPTHCYRHIAQFPRFVIIGALNSMVDLALLNTLIAIFPLHQAGYRYALFKGISFTVAVAHSFIWNKYWVFKKTKQTEKKSRSLFHDSILFFTINILALGGDIMIAQSVFFLGHRLLPFSLTFWANAGALASIGIMFMLRFFTYKKFIFNQKREICSVYGSRKTSLRTLALRKKHTRRRLKD